MSTVFSPGKRDKLICLTHQWVVRVTGRNREADERVGFILVIFDCLSANSAQQSPQRQTSKGLTMNQQNISRCPISPSVMCRHSVDLVVLGFDGSTRQYVSG